MYFHGESFESQHEIWSKQHNGKVRAFQNLCREEEVALRIPVLSTVVVVLALLTGAYHL